MLTEDEIEMANRKSWDIGPFLIEVSWPWNGGPYGRRSGYMIDLGVLIKRSLYGLSIETRRSRFYSDAEMDARCFVKWE